MPRWYYETICEDKYKDVTQVEGGRPKRSLNPRDQVNLVIMGVVVSVHELTTFIEVSKEKEWVEAMQSEFDNLMRNHIWELVELPKGKDASGYIL